MYKEMKESIHMEKDDAYFQLEFGREPAYPYLYNHNPKNRRITQILNMMKRHLYVTVCTVSDGRVNVLCE